MALATLTVRMDEDIKRRFEIIPSPDLFYSAKNQAVLNEAIEQLEAGKGLIEKTWDELEALEHA